MIEALSGYAVIVSALFADMGSAVFSARPQLYLLLALKALNYALVHGATPSCCTTFSRYAIVLASLGAIDDAFAYSELALAAPGSDDAALRVRLAFVHAAYVHCWREPIGASVALLEQACADCHEAGDLPHAGYAAHVATWHGFEAGVPLALVQQRVRHYQVFARQQNSAALVQLLRCYEQHILSLQGANPEGSGEAAGACGRAARARYHLLCQVGAYSFGRYDEALEAAAVAGADQHYFLASVHESTHHFYHALTLAALHGQAGGARRRVLLRALLDRQERLRIWAARCPANFENRYLLVTAEIDRIAGRNEAAAEGYVAALAAAADGGFVQNEVLAAELAARFHDACGRCAMALMFARAAVQACSRWGAYGKIGDLERQFPALLQDLPAALHGAHQKGA